MTKIKNYPTDSNPTDNDRLIGSDGDNGNITKNFTLSSLSGYFNSDLIEYINNILGIGSTGSRLINPSYFNIPGTLQYIVQADAYIINGTIYDSPVNDTVTLSASDATNNRFDVIVVNINGSVTSITGVPSTSPAVPVINEETQVTVTKVLVEANATAPTGVTTELVFDENAQILGGEWDTTAEPTLSIDLASSDQAENGLTSAKFAVESSDNYIIFEDDSTYNGSDLSTVRFGIYIKKPDNYRFSFKITDVSDNLSAGVFFESGQYGFDGRVINEWQIVTIPASAFEGVSSISYDKVQFGNEGSNSEPFYFDFLQIQEGLDPIAGAIPNYTLNLVGTELQLLKDGLVNSTIDLPIIDESKWELFNANTILNNVGVGDLRVPTGTELNDERLSWSANNTVGAFGSPLKLTTGGNRNEVNGIIYAVNNTGYYWSSTISGTDSSRLGFGSGGGDVNTAKRANGYSIRLILNGTFTQQEFNDDYLGETIVIEGLTYGYVYNPTTSKIWLDRNLGATQVATSSTDADAYGWLYQWGRLTDGHQIRTSTTTATLSSTDVPLTDNFIATPVAPFDWRAPQNDNLWQIIEKLIGKNGKKADYNDLLNLPALQDITDEGNVTTNDIQLNGNAKLRIQDLLNVAGFAVFDFISNAIRISKSVGQSFFGIQDNFFEFRGDTGGVARIYSNLLSATREYTLPNKNGTFAMIDDIPTGFVRYDGDESFSNSTEITVVSGGTTNMIVEDPDPVVSLNGLDIYFTRPGYPKPTFNFSEINQVYVLTVVFKARTTNANAAHIQLNFNVSGSVSYTRLSKSVDFYKGNNEIQNFHEVFQFYTDQDLVDNGLSLVLEAIGADVEFGDVIYFIQRCI